VWGVPLIPELADRGVRIGWVYIWEYFVFENSSQLNCILIC